ncbi:MAG: glycerol-3-phosphate acyltransferase [Actinomycetota bacterium]|nr:glycerol-3-phosphate acyltransferase [Actinomycetota bacterium]
MNLGRILWVAGGYLVGTFPSTYLIARAKGAGGVLAAADRNRSEGDAHVLMRVHMGKGWGALAATIDVVKGLVYVLVARRYGHVPNGWLAVVGVVLVTGYTFPFYAQAMAGRGLAASAGVLLALLPVPMIIAGIIIVLGYVARATGPATTLGFAAAPVAAWMQGQPGSLSLMAAGILGILLLRRLEGVSRAASRWGWARALWRRLAFDADPPSRSQPAAAPIEAGEQARSG